MATQIVPAPRRADHQGLTMADTPSRITQLRESIARRALAGIGTPSDARIVRVVRTGPVMTVVTEHPDGYFPYGVDSFRLPIADETDLDQDDRRGLCDWVLVDQFGGYSEDEVVRMTADSHAYAAELQKRLVAA